MNYISTWLYIEEKSDESYYPQVGGSTSKKSVQDIYWKCIYDFFYTSIKMNEGSKHLFFTNYKEKVVIDNIDLFDFMEKNNIKIINVELSHKTPVDWFGAWRNQFYIFDILKYISQNYNENDKFAILDSDCVFSKNVDEMFNEINEYGIISYNMNFDNDHVENGINAKDMADLYNQYYNKSETAVEYYGGEFFAADYKMILKILNEFNYLWKCNYENYNNEIKKLNEEAHFLSLIYKRLNTLDNIGNKYIKRMWTSFKFNNIEPNDDKYHIWHLPSEKKTGFITFFNEISNNDLDKKLSQNDYMKSLKGNFGIPKRNTKKLVSDFITLSKYKVKKS